MTAFQLPNGQLGGLRPMGIETEYGMICQGFAEPVDFAFLASTLVRSLCLRPIHRGWDYSGEDGRLDFFGRRHRLAHDPHDLAAVAGESSRLTRAELIADTILPNGARFYNDHNHPEYCTAATRSAFEVARQDAAGEQLLLACQRQRNARSTDEVLLVKNNTDYHGRSYGTHENYLMKRSVGMDFLIAQMVPFLVSRIALTGAGKAGSEGRFADPAITFQISQRADFFEQIAGINTTARRPIFNTRDEPHSDRRAYRRMHVICGDANRSQLQTALKMGMTALVLDLVEQGHDFRIALNDPMQAIRTFSRDPALGAMVPTSRGQLGMLDVLEIYLQAVEEADLRGPERNWIAAEWRRLLDQLRRDPERAGDCLDWCAKLRLIEQITPGQAGLPAETLRRLDVAYHYLDPRYSIYDQLVAEGRIRTLLDPSEAQAYLKQPPDDTRARLRGRLISHFGGHVKEMEWDSATLEISGRQFRLDLSQVHSEAIAALAEKIEAAADADELVGALAGSEVVVG